jgi:hypothetical protein
MRLLEKTKNLTISDLRNKVILLFDTTESEVCVPKISEVAQRC